MPIKPDQNPHITVKGKKILAEIGHFQKFKFEIPRRPRKDSKINGRPTEYHDKAEIFLQFYANTLNKAGALEEADLNPNTCAKWLADNFNGFRDEYNRAEEYFNDIVLVLLVDRMHHSEKALLRVADWRIKGFRPTKDININQNIQTGVIRLPEITTPQNTPLEIVEDAPQRVIEHKPEEALPENNFAPEKTPTIWTE